MKNYKKKKNSIQVGQEIEVRPGVVTRDALGKFSCRPIKSKILSLYAEQNDLQFAAPGGLIGILFNQSSDQNWNLGLF